jgi:hypothetical protein
MVGNELSLEHPRETYEKYLFSFEKTYDPVTSYSCRDELERVQVQEIQPHLLSSVPIIYPPETGVVETGFWDNVVVQDITLLRRFDVVFDHSLFAVERLLAEYPDVEIDILTQVREACFFKNQSNKEKVLLKDYAQRVLDEIGGKPPSSVVEFAVNIDIDNWEPQVDELRKKLPRRLLWGTDDDALEDVRQHIKGMTLPQLYIKTKGCWTGGHQENLRFCSVNVNHGPGNCEWWAMDNSCTDAFRAKVLEQFHFDIFYQETLWWPDEAWCLAKGFKLYCTLQKPGDIVFVGVGTLHWVRSLSSTVNSSWNLGLKTHRQFEAAFERYAVNDDINFTNLVPLFNLALDLLNFDLPNLPDNLILLLKAQVNARFLLEAGKLKRVVKKQKPQTDTTENVVTCDSCSKEVFFAYAKCWTCHVLRLKELSEEGVFYCVQCHSKHRCTMNRLEFFTKFRAADLKKLNERVSNYVYRRALSSPQDELDYLYDKYSDEHIYKSPYDGVELPQKRPRV